MYDLWERVNSKAEAERIKAELEWDKNDKNYAKTFQSLKNRFSPELLKIYMDNHGFHDFYLVDINIVNEKLGLKKPIQIKITVTDSQKVWEITYNGIKQLLINYNLNNKPLGFGKGFSSWGYDEFLEVDERTLSHEILFASGASIRILFEKIKIKEVKELEV